MKRRQAAAAEKWVAFAILRWLKQENAAEVGDADFFQKEAGDAGASKAG